MADCILFSIHAIFYSCRGQAWIGMRWLCWIEWSGSPGCPYLVHPAPGCSHLRLFQPGTRGFLRANLFRHDICRGPGSVGSSSFYSIFPSGEPEASGACGGDGRQKGAVGCSGRSCLSHESSPSDFFPAGAPHPGGNAAERCGHPTGDDTGRNGLAVPGGLMQIIS